MLHVTHSRVKLWGKCRSLGSQLKGGNKPSASQAALAYQGRGDREVDGKPCPEIAGTCIVYEVTWNRDI
jgi:hypothetical protein